MISNYRKFIFKLIGNGEHVSLWHDPWLPLPYSFKPFSLPIEGTKDYVVGDFIDKDSEDWMHELILELFTKEKDDLILSIPLSLRPTEDKIIWHFDKNRFLVWSSYHVAWLREAN